MLNKIIKLGIMLIVIGIGFLYTEKTIYLVRKYDPVMKKINEVKDNYYAQPVSAHIDDNYYTPGIPGESVDLDKSYLNMKKNGIYDENLLVFTQIDNENKYDYSKYISKINSKAKTISIIVKITDSRNIDELINTLNSKKIKVNFFIKEGVVSNDILNYIKRSNHNIYTYIDNSSESIKEANYCLFEKEDAYLLNYCRENKLISLLPNIIGESNLFSAVKNKLKYGSIILINDINDISNIKTSIDFIRQKGLNIVELEEHLSNI